VRTFTTIGLGQNTTRSLIPTSSGPFNLIWPTLVLDDSITFRMRDMAKATVDWKRVGDRFYRKFQLYDSSFDQDIDFESSILAGAPFSGALGMTSES